MRFHKNPKFGSTQMNLHTAWQCDDAAHMPSNTAWQCDELKSIMSMLPRQVAKNKECLCTTIPKSSHKYAEIRILRQRAYTLAFSSALRGFGGKPTRSRIASGMKKELV